MFAMNAGDCSCELRRIERLGHVRLVARFQGGGAIRNRRIRRHGDRWYSPAPLRRSPSQLSDQVIAVLAWHPDIAEDYVGRALVDFFQCGTRVVDGGDEGTILGKHCPQQITRILLIVDNQDADVAQQVSSLEIIAAATRFVR
jgi:hypothetical protein